MTGEKAKMCEPSCVLYKCDIIAPDTLGRVWYDGHDAYLRKKSADERRQFFCAKGLRDILHIVKSLV